MTRHGIHIPEDQISMFCRRHHVRKLALYGSILRDDFGSDSDVDVLIEFEPGLEVGLIRLAAMAREISNMFGGRPVDLRTPEDLSRYFRDDVVRTAEVHYAA